MITRLSFRRRCLFILIGDGEGISKSPKFLRCQAKTLDFGYQFSIRWPPCFRIRKSKPQNQTPKSIISRNRYDSSYHRRLIFIFSNAIKSSSRGLVRQAGKLSAATEIVLINLAVVPLSL